MESARILSLVAAIAPVATMAYAALLYYDLESFKKDPGTDYTLKKDAHDQSKKELAALERKNTEMIQFVKNLEAKKVEVSELSGKLFEVKSALSDRLDAAEFTRVVLTEAKKVGITVLSIKPRPKVDTEYYREYPFDFRFRGVFPQVYAFMKRVSSMQRLVQIDRLDLKASSKAAARFVELQGEVQIKTFSYLGSKADDIAGKATAEGSPTSPSDQSAKKEGG